MNIATMSDDVFDAEIADAMHKRETFAPFVEPDVALRTFDWLYALIENLENQITRYADAPREPDDDWLRRVNGKLATARARMTFTQHRIRLQSRGSSGNSREQSWKQFAHRLCEALDGSPDESTQDMLDKIPSPFPGMTAGDWLMRRLEKDPARTGANV